MLVNLNTQADRNLDYSDEDITDQGLEYLSELKLITSLQLYVPENISEDGLQKLLKKLPRLASLTLIGLNFSTISFLKDIRSLTYLDLSWSEDLTDEGFEHILSLSSLTYLDLSHCEHVADNGLRYIGQLESLTELVLWESYITDIGLKYISKLTNLVTLWLGNCFSIKLEGFKCLSVLKKLETLYLTGCQQVNDSWLQFMPKSLTSLDLSVSHRITKRGVASLLANNTSLSINNYNIPFIFQHAANEIPQENYGHFIEQITDIEVLNELLVYANNYKCELLHQQLLEKKAALSAIDESKCITFKP